MNKKKVLLIGPYPPPFGGISVQIFRIQKALLRLGHDCQVLNIGEYRSQNIEGAIAVKGQFEYLYKLLVFASRGYILHIITSGHNFKSWLSAFACSLVGIINKRRSVIAVGSGHIPQYVKNARGLLRVVIQPTLRLAGKVVCRNEDSKVALADAGACEENIVIVSGFLGIDASEIGQIPVEIKSFMENHQPVIGAHATVDPEYGLSLVLEASSELVKEFPRLGVILLGLKEDDAVKFPQFEKMREHFFPTGFLQHQEALAVIRELNIFIRATYFDGDSNSVREALYLGVPVVASNTDFRPPGVHLFPVGDKTVLIQKVSSILRGNKYFSRNETDQKQNNNLQKILSIYDML